MDWPAKEKKHKNQLYIGMVKVMTEGFADGMSEDIKAPLLSLLKQVMLLNHKKIILFLQR
jgi:hypothetical protein